MEVVRSEFYCGVLVSGRRRLCGVGHLAEQLQPQGVDYGIAMYWLLDVAGEEALAVSMLRS
jgi:hypothetical protein